MDPTELLKIIIFLVVGVIVSLDVTGLSLAKGPRIGSDRNRTFVKWAMYNASWHAGMLMLYVLIISGILNLSEEIVQFLKFVLSIFSFIFDLINIKLDIAILFLDILANNSRVILGVLALWIVWEIYSAKIVGKPEEQSKGQLTTLPSILFSIFQLIFTLLHGKATSNEWERFKINLHWHGQAAVVAIDMLALAMLMKGAGYLDKNALGDTILLILFVFCVVFLFAYFSSRYSATSFQHLDDSLRSFVQAIARILEPCLIFYFILQLISFLITGERSHNVAFTFGSALLVIGLIRKKGLQNIIDASTAEPKEIDIEKETYKLTPKEFIGEMKIKLRSFAIYTGVSIVFLTAWLALCGAVDQYSKDVFPIFVDSPESTFSRMMLLLLVIYIPINIFSIDKIPAVKKVVPYDYAAKFIYWTYDNRFIFFCVLGAVCIGAVIPIFETMMASLEIQGGAIPSKPYTLRSIGVTPKHIHALQFALWLFYLSGTGGAVHAFMRYNTEWNRCVTVIEDEIREDKKPEWKGLTEIVYGALIISAVGMFAVAWAQEWLRTLVPLVCDPARSDCAGMLPIY